MSILPEQCRAARALLAWSQADLAEAAGISRATLIDFEKGTRVPIAANLRMIENAFKKAGADFSVTEDGRVSVIGPPRPKRRRGKG